MDMKKIEQTILKDYHASESRKELNYGIRDNKVGVLGKTYAFYIDADKFPFNVNVLTGSRPLMEKPTMKIFDLPSGYVPGQLTGEWRLVKTKRGKSDAAVTVVKIETKTRHVWVATDLLKFFDKDATYYINGRLSTVYVCEGDEVVGIVCPFRVEEDKE